MRSNSSPKVLLVDNSPTRADTVDALRALDFRVTTAEGYEQGLDLVLSESPDVLVTELRLGAFNGLHLIIRLRGQSPDAMAVVYTMFPDPVLEQQARQLGASYLIQDGDPSTLVALLAERVSASSFIDASSA